MIKKIIKSTFRKFGYEIVNKKMLVKKKIQPKQEASILPNHFETQQKLIRELNISNPTIFDVGAHRGETYRSYRNLFPEASIYCFEPFPESAGNISKSLENDNKLHVITKAVDKSVGTKDFYINQFAAANSLLPRPENERRYYPTKALPKDVIQVDTISIDQFADENNISEIDVLKFDIQGGELEALKGAIKLLEAQKIKVIYSEILFVHLYEQNPLFKDVWDFLEGYNYSLYDFSIFKKASNGQVIYGDAIFVSDYVRHNVIDKFPEEP